MSDLRAAALMRERAEAALLASGDGAWQETGLGYNDVQGMTYTVRTKARVDVCEANTEEQAEHIASWHPAVALAVANLLDTIEKDVGTSTLAYHAAVAVAHAYRAEPE